MKDGYGGKTLFLKTGILIKRRKRKAFHQIQGWEAELMLFVENGHLPERRRTLKIELMGAQSS